MGFELKDLVAGTYFKGYHAPAPNGRKCFYYVQSTCSQGGLLQADVVYHYRGGGPAGWKSKTFQGPPNEETLLKRQCSPRDLKAEGVSFPVALPSVPAVPSQPPPAAPVAPAAKQPLPVTSVKPTEAELAKAKRNMGKVAIPENAKSPKCVKCNGANRSIALFQFSTYFCPICEPE
jgi:hypothetical protein